MKDALDISAELPFAEFFTENFFFKVIILSKRGKIFPLVRSSQMIDHKDISNIPGIQRSDDRTADKSCPAGDNVHKKLLDSLAIIRKVRRCPWRQRSGPNYSFEVQGNQDR